LVNKAKVTIYRIVVLAKGRDYGTTKVRSMMKRVISTLIVLVLLLFVLTSSSLAGSDSTYVLQDLHTFYLYYGSTEQNSSTALINYIQAQVTVPGLRIWDQVCSIAYIYSQGQLKYQSGQTCIQYGPGLLASTQQWYVYQPSDPNSRVQVLRGQAEIKIDYSYTYNGQFNQYKCENGLCGATTVSLSIPPAGLGDIGGIVKNLSGQLISGATVTFNGGGTTRTTTTNASGSYLFSSVPADGATIRAVYNGQAGSVNTTVYGSQSTRAPDIYLNQCAQGNILNALNNSCGDVPTPTAQPSPPATGWNQTFYSDNNLGSQCGTRNETDVYMFRDSDGGWSPPSGCPSADQAWSVRMVRNDASFQGGTYEFGLFNDDAARLYVDGVLRVDGWNATQHYESQYVSPGNHQLKLEYKNNAGHAIVQLWWRGPGALPFNDPSQRDPNQWWVNYWGNQTQWQDSVGQQNEGTGFIDHNWGYGGPGFGIPADHFSLRFERSVYFDCGIYRFHLISDDGSLLLIDGAIVTLFDHFTPNTWDNTADVTFQRGGHTLRVDYFENGGEARVSLDWLLLAPCAPPPPPSTPGDANGDGKVDGIDYVIWLNHYNQATINGPKDGDFNNDGKVDGIDYVIWLTNYGTSLPSTSTSTKAAVSSNSVPNPPSNVSISSKTPLVPVGHSLGAETSGFSRGEERR
jgi:hypothetical protein